MPISPYREQRIMLLARLNLGLASQNQEEIDLYDHYKKNKSSKQKKQQKKWCIN